MAFFRDVSGSKLMNSVVFNYLQVYSKLSNISSARSNGVIGKLAFTTMAMEIC